MTLTRLGEPAYEAPAPGTGKNRRKPTWAIVLILAVIAGLSAAMLLVDKREIVGGLSLALMLVLMFVKVPVALALIVPALLGLLSVVGPRAVITVLSDTPFDSAASWSLSVLPMFILMGTLLGSSGITGRMYVAAQYWLNWLPGGMAVSTNVAGGALGAVSGSTIGITYALGRVGIPEMISRGYHPRMAVGAVAAAGLPGQLIPPSTFLIVVAGITGAGISEQLIAGVLPGVLMVGLAIATIIAIALIWPGLAGGTKEERAARAPEAVITWRTRIGSLAGVWPVLLLFVAVVGAMFGGVMTATEAGAFGAFCAVLLTWFFRRKDNPWSIIVKGTAQTVVSVGAIFFVIVGAFMITKMFAVTGVGRMFSNMVMDLGLNRVEFLLVMVLVYVILGTAMDSLPMLLLTIPLLQPSFEHLGIDILWFGVFAVIMGELAMLSPPVGLLAFVVHTIAQDREVNLGKKISLNDVYVGTLWFYPGIVGLVLAMIIFPDWVTWLPDMMR